MNRCTSCKKRVDLVYAVSLGKCACDNIYCPAHNLEHQKSCEFFQQLMDTKKLEYVSRLIKGKTFPKRDKI